MCACMCVCVCLLLWSVRSGVEEPEMVLSIHQSAIKQENENECRSERETRSQEAVIQIIKETKEEKREAERELQADADITLDFTNTGAHASLNINEESSQLVVIFC